jgi:hypothetical protein
MANPLKAASLRWANESKDNQSDHQEFVEHFAPANRKIS